MGATLGGRVIQMEDASGFPVAVKRWHKTEKRADRARWEQEILKLVQGPGVPGFVRAFEDADYCYVVTEWISGVSLDRYIEEQGGFLESREALTIGRELYGILKRLHYSSRGPLVYTDLKPENVLLKGRQVYLVDYESVCPAGKVPVDCDDSTVIMGSRPFTAPEVFTGRISEDCDFYSLGALLFYMITGELWQGDAAPLQGDQLGSRILKLLSPDPSHRKAGMKLFQYPEPTEERAPVISDSPVCVREELQPVVRSDKRILFVEDNPRFAVELAYEASLCMNFKVCLFSMVEESIPLAAGNLGIRRVRMPEHFEGRADGEDILTVCDAEEWMRRGLLMQPEGFGRLYIGLKSPARLAAARAGNGWQPFLQWAVRQFDLTVIFGRMGKELPASFCDAVILAPQSNRWDAEDCRRRQAEFAGRGGALPVCIVAWEYKEGVSLPIDRFSALVGEADFLGEIYHDGSRQIAENKGESPYCFAMPGIIRQQYLTILQKLMQKLQ